VVEKVSIGSSFFTHSASKWRSDLPSLRLWRASLSDNPRFQRLARGDFDKKVTFLAINPTFFGQVLPLFAQEPPFFAAN
jgi:hypothetical protein